MLKENIKKNKEEKAIRLLTCLKIRDILKTMKMSHRKK